MANSHPRTIIRQQEQEEAQQTTKHQTPHPKNMMNKGAWTSEEDTKLAEVIEIYGPRRWTSIAVKAELNRCGKSCRLRWMNYLRPNIKRGNISDQEEDLILRLHKLLGNRWSLIAGRIPGRTDNEIKNYWNSHLSKKMNQNSAAKPDPKKQSRKRVFGKGVVNERAKKMEVKERGKDQLEEVSKEGDEEREMEESVDDFFDFTNEKLGNLEWVTRFLELDERGECQFQ